MVQLEDIISIRLPVSMRFGLDEASKKTNFSKADIVRSLIYGFLVEGGFMQPMTGIDENPEFVE